MLRASDSADSAKSGTSSKVWNQCLPYYSFNFNSSPTKQNTKNNETEEKTSKSGNKRKPTKRKTTYRTKSNKNKEAKLSENSRFTTQGDLHEQLDWRRWHLRLGVPPNVNTKPFPCGALTVFAYRTNVTAAIFAQCPSRIVAKPRIICRRSHSKHPRDHGRKARAPVDPVRLREGFQVRNEAKDAEC